MGKSERKNLVWLENLLHAERNSSKDFVNVTSKNVKERNREERS